MAARVERINAALPGYVVHLTCDGCHNAHHVARTDTVQDTEPEMEALWEVIQSAESDASLRWCVTPDGRVLCRPCALKDETAFAPLSKTSKTSTATTPTAPTTTRGAVS